MTHACVRALTLLVTLAAPGLAAPGVPPLLPRTALFGPGDRYNPQVSPDGQWLAYSAPAAGEEGRHVLHLAPTSDPTAVRVLDPNKQSSLFDFEWAADSKHVLYSGDPEAGEQYHVYAADIASGQERDLTPIDGVRAMILAMDSDLPEEVVLGLNDRDPSYYDLYRVNIVTGERTLLLQNDGKTSEWVLGDGFAVRYTGSFRDGGSLHFEPRGGGKPFDIPADDLLVSEVLAADDHGHLLMLDSRGRDTAALVEVDLNTNQTKVLAQDPRADIVRVVRNPDTGKIEAAVSEFDRYRYHVLDPAFGKELEFLRTLAPGDIVIGSRSDDNRWWTVIFDHDAGPVSFFLFDRTARAATRLWTDGELPEGVPGASMKPVVIDARDGLKLPGYLTLPPWTDLDGDGRPARPVPMVLDVHGGPWARVSWGFNPEYQLLANRGYAVLAINFRGSTGFGKKFLNAGYGEWGGKMQLDLIDTLRWAVAQHIVPNGRTCISGGSYGGYAALCALTFTPGMFACGISFAGPTDLPTWLESTPTWWRPGMPHLRRRVYGPLVAFGGEKLAARSPLTYVGNLKAPLLVAQGTEDPRVPREQSDRFVEALEQADTPVTYLVFYGEAHGLGYHKNQLAYYASIENFLARHLGGRAEPIGDAFVGSSCVPESGVELIPGLRQGVRHLFGLTYDDLKPLPAAPDPNPDRTKALLAAMVDRSTLLASPLLNEGCRERLGQRYSVDMLSMLLGLHADRTGFEFLKEETDQSGFTHVYYRAPVEDRRLYWRITYDQDGRIQWIFPYTEEFRR